MRKILCAALAATIVTPIAAQAQSAREVRHDQREVQHDRNEVRRDIQNGRLKEAREDSRELREDQRERNEDWRAYRRSHGEIFRRGVYRGPRGYVYRPVTVGFRFAPAYYARSYWITDPWTYRLTRPAAGLTWIRYGNDAILVNLRTGRVVQVYNGFFF